jgi:putative nucleotidyltransferase with HDIG domain
VLLKSFDGIVIAADKMTGRFDEEDAEALISIGDHASVAVDNVRLQRELRDAYVATVTMLADAVEAKDPYTHGHCEMVSYYARRTAERLNLKDPELSLVCYGALLHDVGKIGVSDGILNKPGPLLPEERELVRSHVRVGFDLISKVPALKAVAEVVLHHHEWYDGTGYPNGLSGETIPVASRIVCVVDSYSAMVTKRPYKEPYSDEEARAELRRCAGTQFDPKVVEAFLSVLESTTIEEWELDELSTTVSFPGIEYLGAFCNYSPEAYV